MREQEMDDNPISEDENDHEKVSVTQTRDDEAAT